MSFKEICKFYNIVDENEKESLKGQLEELIDEGYIFKRMMEDTNWLKATWPPVS